MTNSHDTPNDRCGQGRVGREDAPSPDRVKYQELGRKLGVRLEALVDGELLEVARQPYD